jgi:hypothetical protein
VAKSFSPEARVVSVAEDQDLVLAISWRLGTDPERPSKRSKTVQLTISQEALDDYARAPEGQKQASDARLERHLAERLTGFDPEHQAPLGHEPPIERWLVDTMTLVG